MYITGDFNLWHVPSLSVIIVTYNSARTIGACLRSLVAGMPTAEETEIVVIDNCSRDGSAEVVHRDFPSIRVITSDSNTGFAAAANRAAHTATSAYLLFLNPDTIVQPEFFSRLNDTLAADRSIVLAGCRLTTDDGRPQPSAWRLPNLATLAAESFLPHALSTARTRRDRAGLLRGGFVSGGGLVIQSSLFRELGGFDERFFMYYEDADLCRRAGAKGYLPIFLGALRIVHHGRGSYGEKAGDFFVHYYRSKLQYCALHFSPRRSAIARWMIRSGIALRVPVYRAAALLTGKKEFAFLAEYHRTALRSLAV